MPITPSLNLALPIRLIESEQPDPDNPDKTVLDQTPLIWAYHTPLSVEVFEQNYRIFRELNDELFSKGTQSALTSGLRVATLALKDVARNDALNHETQDAGSSLLAEIRRLTNILAPTDQGFDLIPVDIALSKKLIEPEEWSECESVIVFFTCGYRMARPSKREAFGKSLALVLRGLMTSSNPTEFAASLRTSTPAEISVPPTPSLVPS